jgi:HSP20 family protein
MYRFIRYAQPFAANAAAYRSTWSGLEREINSLFASTEEASSATRSIPVSVHEDKENLRITAELPGVQRADVNVEIVDDVLSLSATRKVVEAEGEQTVSFAREFNLPYPVQADKIAAELKDGVLRLTLPKVEAVKPRKIEVS